VNKGPVIYFRGDFDNDIVRIAVNNQPVFSDTILYRTGSRTLAQFNMKIIPEDGEVEICINDGESNTIQWNSEYCYMHIRKRGDRIRIKNSRTLRTGFR
jgi:hypothetical protein